jgi:hypothetical protein
LISSQIQARSEASFICTTEKTEFNGYFSIDLKIEGFLESSSGIAKLSHYQIEYQVFDGNEIWSQANINSTNSLFNNSRYNPRVYTNHFQFIISKEILGEIYFIVPKNFAQSEDDKFDAYVIMTAIEDHAGDTVAIECSIDP